jgi:hypothetical protein
MIGSGQISQSDIFEGFSALEKFNSLFSFFIAFNFVRVDQGQFGNFIYGMTTSLN